MAESAVTFLLDKLPLLEEEVKLLRGVRGEVKFITDELESMRAFLRKADAWQDSDESIKAWVKQVRDVAYDTEDIMDEFILCLAQRPDQRHHGYVGFLHKTSCFFRNLKECHRLASGIQDIKARVRGISERSQRYRFNIQEQGSSSNSPLDTWHDLPGDALLLPDAEIVCIDKPKEELIKLLVEGESRLAVVSVVGIGGLGTTLAKKVYNDQKVNRYFEHHAWVTVSQSCKIEELLRDMIAQVFGEINQQVPPGVETMKDIKLKEILKDFLLQKRYVIVFDDISRIQAWDAIKYALYDSECGSRIIVTTHFADIASSCKQSFGYVFNLQPLPPQDSWTLVHKKAFLLNLENSCLLEPEKCSRSIVRKCEGLPLAIVTISCLLPTKGMDFIEWQTVHRGLGADLQSNERLKSMTKVLIYGFNDLPYYLKACFMYLSIFSEDCLINRMRLIRLWIAEGFVEEKEGKTVEDVAERYFYELVNRSLIQVAEMDVCGRVKRCQVHDLMRDFILAKSREDYFGTVVEKNTKVPEKIRRLSIHNSDENVAQSNSFSCLRSLFSFGKVKLPDNFFSGFRLLKVIDLKGAPVEMFPNEIVNLFHLRYLSMKKTNIKMLPNSIGKLQNLETLDLKYTYVYKMPVEILKLQKLRHLLVHGVTSYGKPGFKAFMGIGGLAFLQKLLYIEANQDSDIIRELGRLNQLRRLGITKLRKEDGIFLCSSIEKMSNLRSLIVKSIAEQEILDLQSLSSVPSLLQRLYMNGRLEKLPRWISSLHNLNIIYFGGSRLREDPLEALQALPNLMELRLFKSYDGEVLCFKAGGFQRLKILLLKNLERLRLMSVEEGAMPLLQRLDISQCGVLEKVPLGIERLTNLKDLRFTDMPDEFKMRLLPDQGGVDHSKVAHIPNVWFGLWGNKGWRYNRLVETGMDSMRAGSIHKTKGPRYREA